VTRVWLIGVPVIATGGLIAGCGNASSSSHTSGGNASGDGFGQGENAFGASWYVLAPTGQKVDNS
jgi:hypothetical protein